MERKVERMPSRPAKYMSDTTITQHLRKGPEAPDLATSSAANPFRPAENSTAVDEVCEKSCEWYACRVTTLHVKLQPVKIPS
jgi:hypothetical protein